MDIPARRAMMSPYMSLIPPPACRGPNKIADGEEVVSDVGGLKMLWGAVKHHDAIVIFIGRDVIERGLAVPLQPSAEQSPACDLSCRMVIVQWQGMVDKAAGFTVH